MRKYLILLLPIMLLFACSDNKAEEYRNELRSVADDMLENSANIEDVVNDYAFIWSFSIENRSPIGVSEMAEKTGFKEYEVKEIFEINSAGNVPNDFSINVHSLKAHYEELGIIGDIRETSEDIKDRVSDLNDPPKGYEDAYKEILDLYDLSEKYVDMALNPSGSLQDFNEEKNQLSNDILSKYKRIDVVVPNED